MSEKVEVIELDMDKLHTYDWNPNTQSDKVFNALVENIKEIGMVEPIMVAPREDGSGEFDVVSGAHRYEACKMLDYEKMPCIVRDFDEDKAKFQNVRMNVLKGKLDPVKFTKLFDEMAEKYGEEMTKEMMAFVDENAFNAVYVNVRDQLPDEMKDKLDSAKDDIKTVDDLSTILNEMFSRYGDTLDNDYMIFTYGGKSHYWIQMDSKVKSQVERISDLAMSLGISINQLLGKILTSENADEELAKLVAEGEVKDPEKEMKF